MTQESRSLKFSVTAEDVRLGKQNDDCCCPIALALTRAAEKQASVSEEWIIIEGKHIRVPEDLANKIVSYDKTGIMEPFDYELST
jgi:hypothetical protein